MGKDVLLILTIAGSIASIIGAIIAFVQASKSRKELTKAKQLVNRVFDYEKINFYS